MSEPAPASTDLEVVPDDVVDAGRYVQMTADELAGALRSLDVDVSNLLATWKGSSASAYSAGWEETKQGAMEVLEALAAIAELLGVNSRVFAEQDTDNSQGFGSLNIQV